MELFTQNDKKSCVLNVFVVYLSNEEDISHTSKR